VRRSGNIPLNLDEADDEADDHHRGERHQLLNCVVVGSD
jgi:hypothetical protein